MKNNGNAAPVSLKIGMHVDINPQSDRTRKIMIQGVISEILTKSDDHPHGVLVLLESGEKGRVKAILGNDNSKKTDSNSSSSLEEIKTSSSLKEIIDQGENHHIEFKASALWSSKFTNADIKNFKPQSSDLHLYGKNLSKIIIAKTIAGFLNSDGGALIIGLKENKNDNENEIVGIEVEYGHLKDKGQDGYRRMLIDVIKDNFPSDIFNHLNQYLKINIEKIDNKVICGIIVSGSDKRVFLKLKGVDHFYIRTDASTRELHGEEILEYCLKRFL